MGLNIGDVIIDTESDIFGEGVNVAARLEQLAAPGELMVSGKVVEEVEGKVQCTFEDRGTQHVKNIARPVRVYAAQSGDPTPGRVGSVGPQQEINFCRAPDGVRLAWSKVGTGPPLVKAANWMNHLEYDWMVWGNVLEGLAKHNTLIRYDSRGSGLSDREVEDISLEAWVSDLEEVVKAAGLTRFPLIGFSQGCAISILYAAKHPERVSHLILYDGFAVGGAKRSPEERAKREAMATLIRLGWGGDDPTFRQMFTCQFMPDASKQEIDIANDVQRRTTSPENAERFFNAFGQIDIREFLPKVSAPTLVMHVRGDLICPIESGRQLAAGIPGARFIAFEGRNHIFRSYDPAAERFFDEVRAFLGQTAGGG
jgi:pimeloyl-ACP methyl ester carboxylesterase